MGVGNATAGYNPTTMAYHRERPVADDEKTASLILEYLRRLDKRQAAMHEDLMLIRDRLGSLESQASLMRGDPVRLEHRLDRMDARVARIERRLDLANLPGDPS